MTSTQMLDEVSTKRRRIAELAREYSGEALVSLAHHMDLNWLKEAYRRTRKSGAPGVDGMTAHEYAAELKNRLSDLLDRAKSGSYRAPPVRRIYIPKSDGTKRPIGIPTFEDKLLQRAVMMLLEPVYEQVFHPDSYGFRPGRAAHQALEVLDKRLMEMGGGWVIELDIRSYFDTIDHALLRELVQRRVKDGVVNRLLGKWLKAGVLEDGQWSRAEAGSPQGGVISPLLANIYLHYILDDWFESEVKPRTKGRSFLVRFADDAVLVFASEQDARRVLEVLPKRFARFGLELHPTKTRLVCFRPPRYEQEGGTFDLLGFTHYWGEARNGRWVVKRKTARSRFRDALKRVSDWCRRYRHLPLREQHAELSAKLRGHFSYYGIRGNAAALRLFRLRVEETWRRWLARRSQRSHLKWETARKLFARFKLPPARLVHT